MKHKHRVPLRCAWGWHTPDMRRMHLFVKSGAVVGGWSRCYHCDKILGSLEGIKQLEGLHYRRQHGV